jgi:hypothetical protein
MTRLVERCMPLLRYFLFVGGVLLALLFISDALLPKLTVADRASANLPVIRIVSDRKPPERIVYDTSLPTIIPPHLANTDLNIRDAGNVGDPAAKERERAALAQLSDAKQLQAPDSRKREARQHRRYRVARRRLAPAPAFMVARQWRFGWFGNSIW